MFYKCTSLTSIDLSHLDTSNVTNMSNMFEQCINLTSLDLSNFDTSNVTHMFCMFRYCYRLTSLDLSSLDTSNLIVTYGMFQYCYDLNYLIILGDISKVTGYGEMFTEIDNKGTFIYNCAYEDKWNEILVTNNSASRFPLGCTKTCVTV